MIHASTTLGIPATNGLSCTTHATGDEHDPRDGLMRDLDLPRGDERKSLTSTCVIRAWCCLIKGTGDVFCPATKWPMSRLAPFYVE
jgi:hypothetical protein